MPNGAVLRRVVVKFQDAVDLPYEDGAEAHVSRLGIGDWPGLALRFKGIRLNRLFTVVTPERIGELVARASDHDRFYRAPNLTAYFVIDVPAEVDPAALAAALREWAQVEAAYVDPLDASPGPTGSNPAYAAGLQTYLKPPAVAAPPAPQGAIDAEFAWAQPLGAGDEQKLVDLERGADLGQEDIQARNIQTLYGLNIASAATDRLHGAKVLCLVAGVDNDKGVVGIAYGLKEVAYTCQVVAPGTGPGTVNRPDAVMAAIQHFSQAPETPFGRVLLLEVELGPANDQSSLTDVHGRVWNQMPMETALADFEAIRLASALGIVVVEAAGNGANNLDLWQESSAGKFVLSRDHPLDLKDSGAIMVAGSTANYPYRPAVPAPLGGTQRTCFGSRIDCFAWAEQVATCDGGGNPPTYSRVFGGSSAASAIVAGAALLVQGIAEATPTGRLSPAAMRALLSDPSINTHSASYGTDRIGVMPNLRRILQEGLNIVPDVYIRDNVNDNGSVDTGAISLSPDIIVRPVAEANPAVTFGPGTENDLMLGPTATPGQDNFVYARVWNRGTVAASAVTVTVFYATPATLVMGDAWNPVGTPVVIGNVPAGNVMTVSSAIQWPAAQVPPAGHYCFVALVGNAQDPSPPRASFLSFDNYYAFIRNNNNVTWRNFDVVSNPAPAAPWNLALLGADPYELEFEAPGAYDSDRTFQLVVGSSLPSGSRVLLEAPLDLLSRRLPVVERDGDRGRVSIGPHARTTFPAVSFPAKSRARCRLLVEVPRSRARACEVYVSQLYEGFEVGRITWRIVARP